MQGVVRFMSLLFELHSEDGAWVGAGALDADVGHGAPVGGGGELVPAGLNAVAVVGFVGSAGGEFEGGGWRSGRKEVGFYGGGFGFAVVVFGGGECGGFEGGGVRELFEAVEVGF